jgi:hypothetical protein
MAFVPSPVPLPKGVTERVLCWSSAGASAKSSWLITQVREPLVGRFLDLGRWNLTPTGPGTESGMDEGILTFNNAQFPAASSFSDLLLSLNWSLGRTLTVFATIDGTQASFDIQLIP